MKRQKKLVALILMVCLSCSLFSGCGKEGNQNGNKDGEKLTFDPADGPLVPYEEPLVVTQVKYQNPGTSYISEESMENNFITELYKEKLNIEWKANWVTDVNSYYTKLNMDIAGDDLPDVFKVDAAQLQTLIENDQIEDLTDYYDYYASDRLKENVGYDDGFLLQYPTVDGRLYGIPVPSSYAGDTGFMWIRTDWMEQLGLSAPTTFEELRNYIKALKESGLCKKGTCGFSFLGAGSVSFDSISQMFGTYYDYFIKDEETGELIYTGVSDEMKETLKALQDMVKEGLIDGDWASKGSTEEELISTGGYGIVFGQYFYSALCKGSVLSDPKADWAAFPLPALDKNSTPRPKGTNYRSGYIVVRKGYEHPEVALKSMNLWAEIFTDGGEYNTWMAEKTADKYKNVNIIGEYALPYTFDGVLTFNVIGEQIRATLASENPDEEIKKYPFSLMTYQYMRDPSAADFVSGNGWFLKKVYTTAAPVMDGYMGHLQFNEFQGMLSEEAAFNKVALDTLMVETYTNIIMGESIDSFDTFVEDWYKQGGEQILKEVNEWYSKK